MKNKWLTPLPLYLLAFFMSMDFSSLWAHEPLPRASPRIVGGQKTSAEAWPWLATLVTRNTLSSEEVSLLEGQFCAGTLIHPRWVLTAAHCVFDSYYTTVLSNDQVDVVFGINNLRTDQGERIHVKRIVIHPQYNNLQTDFSDIALLELETSVDRPIITFNTNPSLPLEGTIATVIGWGDTSTVSQRPLYLDELQQVSVPIVSKESCQTSLQQENISEIVSPPTVDRIICAGETGKDSCYGDSGGPLVIAEGQEWKQVGIVSGGTSQQCAKPNSYGIYTEVSKFSEFIGNILCQETDIEDIFTRFSFLAPHLTLTVEGNWVTVSWDTIPKATGYEILYAPYPEGTPVGNLNVGQVNNYSIQLGSGQNYYVALRAYQGICYGDFSNIDFFTIP